MKVDIVSTEIVKPSSPTPSHLKTYNLTLIDQMLGPYCYIPLILFYKNTDKLTLDHLMKKSLSLILAKYYPFAGKHARVAAAYVDCNDDGVEVLAASIDTTLSDFLQNSQREDLDQLFPYGQVWHSSNRKSESEQVTPVAVQINHFECGGVALAVSLSHKVADAHGFFHFVHDWAKMTRFLSNNDQKHVEFPSDDPHFLSYPYRNLNFNSFPRGEAQDCVTMSFMFPNSEIDKLKFKVEAESSGPRIMNPTNVDVLAWLLYKCAVEAATRNNSGVFVPSAIHSSVDLRTNMIPEKGIGNYYLVMEIATQNESEMKAESFISARHKQRMRFERLANIEDAYSLLLPNAETGLEEQRKKIDGAYFCSSLCGFGAYDVDFGWGKPVKSTLAGNMRNSFILMDAPNGDGIEVLVCLGKKDMEIFQSHPELLCFAN